MMHGRRSARTERFCGRHWACCPGRYDDESLAFGAIVVTV